jgi:oligo-1,6-glucosidase
MADRKENAGPSTHTPDRAWWKEAVVYQIYPRSFNDSDGDGIGDLEGIAERVEYLADLGVDVVWLCPVYESPNADNGYDIADYRAIMSEFGTMADWEALVEALHDRGIRLIMDLVVNHTSDEHEWFVRSAESTDNDFREYYYWREGRSAGGSGESDFGASKVPPNNWESQFGGPAWSFDTTTGEWYLHLFDEKQPDLKWEHPEVREEVFEVMRWWLERGIDGFRMDVINMISKPDGLPDGEADTGGTDQYMNGPKLPAYLAEMDERALRGYDTLTVGEMPGVGVEQAREYLATGALDMIFQFDHVDIDQGEHWWERSEWSLSEFKAVFSRWQEGLYPDGWNALYLGNHDQPRIVSRFGSERYRQRSAKLLATFLCTLRGTPYIYQGEEIGMTNVSFDSLEQYRDVATLNPVRTAIEEGVVAGFEEIDAQVRQVSRDNARTPMQWDGTTHAGFTDGEPWISVNTNYETINVERARADPESVFSFYQDVIALRKREDVLVYGEYDLLLADDEQLYAYTRTLDAGNESESPERALVVLNFSDERVPFEPPERVEYTEEELLLANCPIEGDATLAFEARPWEARVYRLG